MAAKFDGSKMQGILEQLKRELYPFEPTTRIRIARQFNCHAAYVVDTLKRFNEEIHHAGVANRKQKEEDDRNKSEKALFEKCSGNPHHQEIIKTLQIIKAEQFQANEDQIRQNSNELSNLDKAIQTVMKLPPISMDEARRLQAACEHSNRSVNIGWRAAQ